MKNIYIEFKNKTNKHSLLKLQQIADKATKELHVNPRIIEYDSDLKPQFSVNNSEDRIVIDPNVLTFEEAAFFIVKVIRLEWYTKYASAHHYPCNYENIYLMDEDVLEFTVLYLWYVEHIKTELVELENHVMLSALLNMMIWCQKVDEVFGSKQAFLELAKKPLSKDTLMIGILKGSM